MRARWIPGVALLWACGGPAPEPSAAGVCLDPPRGPALHQFANVTTRSGLDFRYTTLDDFKAGGLAVADFDGDGLPDVVASRRVGGLALFHNRGQLRFAKVDDAGLDRNAAINAIAAVDLDNDGDVDLVLAGTGFALVMANRGDGTFDQVARFDDSGSTEQVLPVDLDGDGLLDLYFSNYDLDKRNDARNRVYLNRGGLQFVSGGMVGSGMTWTTTAFDFDGDGDQDLYVANDTLLTDFGNGAPPGATNGLVPDYFFRNDGAAVAGGMQFTDLSASLGLATPRSSMGGLLGDFDGDGHLDLYVPNDGAKKLFVRDPGSGYVESAARFGVEGTARRNAECGPDTTSDDCLILSWSAALSDFDVDGYDELLVVNGETELGKPPPVLMFARGADPTFHEVSPDFGCLDARGLVVTDLDGDGDQDVVISQRDGPLVVFQNLERPAPGMWLRVTLRGHASNREGRGALVTAHLASGRAQLRVVGSGGVINSSSPAEAFFGLGADQVETLEVVWPTGRRTVLSRPPSGELVVDEGP